MMEAMSLILFIKVPVAYLSGGVLKALFDHV